MPRASASAKRQQGAVNHRDTRHENGLVGPAKRLPRKKSHTQLDGSNGRLLLPDAAVATPALPSPLPHATNGIPKGGHGEMGSEARTGESPRRGSFGGYSETSSSESIHLGNGMMETHRQIDVNAAKNADVHRDSGPLELAATVLKALPLYDTLAILIILMQVPPVALSGIYMVFTFLTFVPPVTLNSGMNIKVAEILDWNTGAMPSLVTVLCMDFFIIMVWLFLWPPIQHAILDFAKPVIAVTLGGGTSREPGMSSRNVTYCFLLVIASHVLRSSRLHWSRAARSVLPPQWGLSPDPDDPLEAISSRRGPHGWIKTVLAIHILTQGIVRYIREWYIRREKGNATALGLADPEAGKTAGFNGDGTDAGFATPDTEASFQPHSSTVSSVKKRRKQSTQVRLQQPLWAALASTKIVVVKEYELSHASLESIGSATDIHNMGRTAFDGQAGQIWISYVGCDEVCFDTSHFEDLDPEPVPPGVDTSRPFRVRVNHADWQLVRTYRHDDKDEAGNPITRWSGDIYGLRPMSKFLCEFVDAATDEAIFSTSICTTQAPSKAVDGAATSQPNEEAPARADSPSTTLRTSIAIADTRLTDEKTKLKTFRKECKNKVNALRREIERLDNAVQSAGSNDDKLRQKIQQQETQKAQAEKDMAELEAQTRDLDSAAAEGLSDRKKETEKSWATEKAAFDAAQREFKRHKVGLEGDVKSKVDEKTSLQSKRSKVAARISKVDGELARITDANNRGLDEAERRRQERVAWEAKVANYEMRMIEDLSAVRAGNNLKQEQINAVAQQLQSFQETMNTFANGATSYDAHHMQPQQSFTNPLSTHWGPTTQNSTSHFAPQPSIWPTNATSTNTGAPCLPLPASAAPGASGLPSSSMWSLPTSSLTSLGPIGPKARGRSSSMLSDVSGFTQSSNGGNADEDLGTASGNSAGNGAGVIGGPSSTNATTVANPLRSHYPPPGFPFQRHRQRSDGGSGSGRSSVRSGSGSAGSARDPTSPI
jgi:ubiquitination network signaling protein AcrB